MTDSNPKRIHRIFYYDEFSGESIPVEEVKLENGGTVLVPIELNEDGEKIQPQQNQSEGQ